MLPIPASLACNPRLNTSNAARVFPNSRTLLWELSHSDLWIEQLPGLLFFQGRSLLKNVACITQANLTNSFYYITQLIFLDLCQANFHSFPHMLSKESLPFVCLMTRPCISHYRLLLLWLPLLLLFHYRVPFSSFFYWKWTLSCNILLKWFLSCNSTEIVPTFSSSEFYSFCFSSEK